MAKIPPSDGGENSILGTYICTEPLGRPPFATDHGPVDVQSLLGTLQTSVDYFSKLGRLRTVERVWFEMARLSMLHGKWSVALQILLPLWQDLSWRRSGWFVLLEKFDLMLRECARRTGDAQSLVAVEWELLCHRKHSSTHHRQGTFR